MWYAKSKPRESRQKKKVYSLDREKKGMNHYENYCVSTWNKE